MTALITGKVARILNSRDLVINRGSADHVQKGMRFAVLDTSGSNIRDPDTGEVIGSVQRTKIEVEIIQVEERISVARTFRAKTVNVGGSGLGSAGAIASLFAPPKYETRYETLKLADASYEPLEEEESIVEIGDSIVQLASAGDDSPPTTEVVRSAAPVTDDEK